ncbi:MAG: hypothetical protein OSB38_18715 [Paraburkholderia fungorum]|nr:hypothetical protein [Paraburkholderia fungorum]
MSVLAKDLMELRAIRGNEHGALVEHLMREIALCLIAAGVADQRKGC